MVAVARILNVTLVIPELDKTSYWNDPSDFGEIFDEEHFINELKDHVRIVRELPDELKNVTAFRKAPVSWSQVKRRAVRVLGSGLFLMDEIWEKWTCSEVREYNSGSG
jgi:hypothetical protein